MMKRVYHDEDADLGAIGQKTIAIIGYGIQGRVKRGDLP